ncbi:hypothetical protein [Limnochorda pilosa]|uniref:SHOCT domain-containing protein n=1 Tax=Limnochorda pilosa TaxID=1555112 RepID=A0A0K2SQ78_LIMPI|nr:hypothetical protein [Limnochorda pilosa]BAS29251.1 hypothetical protein LIP_3439 [Limnochorda pilosa]
MPFLLQTLPLLNQGFHGGSANVRLWMRVTGQPGHAGMLGGVLMILVGLAAGIGLLYVGRRAARRGQGIQLAGESDVSRTLGPDSAGELFEALVGLEASHLRGEVPDDAYRARREALMGVLVQLETERAGVPARSGTGGDAGPGNPQG